LEKWPGKGGWTYAAVPGIPQNPKNPFGWVQVRGRIDDIEFENVKLMPMGNGQLFFPVNAALRKKIGKQAGDWVKLDLEPDDSVFTVPIEIMQCLEDNPAERKKFTTLSEGEQRKLSHWVYAVKSAEMREARIVALLNGLASNYTVTEIIEKKPA